MSARRDHRPSEPATADALATGPRCRRWTGRRRRATPVRAVWWWTRQLGMVLTWLGIGGLAVLAASSLIGEAEPARGQAAASGEQLYQQQCVQCHGSSGEGTQRGPALTEVGAASADFYLRSGRMPIDDPGQEVARGEPHFNDAQIRALVDYVDSLGEGPAVPDLELGDVDQSRGGELYRLNCASCHNWDGKGGALVGRQNAPDLHAIPSTQIAEAVRIGPGSMPRFGTDVLTDEDLADVVAYVQYLDEPEDEGGYGLAHWGPATEAVAAFLSVGALLVITGWLGERRQA